MKKLLLCIHLILVSSLFVFAQGNNMDPKGATMALHEAHFKVWKYNTKEPIAQAGVHDQAGKQLGQTDARGLLVLNLPASASDIYQIKAQGYNPVSIRLTQATKATAEYDVFLPASTEGELIKGQQAPQNVSQNDPDLVKVYVKQDPSTYQKPNSSSDQGVEFAVQLSATSRPITDKNSLKSWESIGPVFIHSENGLYKVRIGPYDTQEMAKQVLLQVKSKGKSDAFIVVQKGIENHVPFDPAKNSDKTTITEIQQPDVANEPNQKAETADAEIIEYKVQLASYLKPGGFNTKDVEMYGPLESYRKGEWTIMMIGGFKTAQEAEKVRDIVIAKGYTDAAVVVDRGGILETE